MPTRTPTSAAGSSEADRGIGGSVDALSEELVEFRRDLHAHPELSWQEQRTTARVADRLSEAGVRVQALPRSGLVAELGAGERVVVLRADLDALPVDDRTTDPWTSTVPAVAHACGHDVHTSAVLGAGLCLAALDVADPLPGRVRLLFQPAEEMIPGGAPELIAAGALKDVSYAFALHCDPTLDVGHVGLRSGAITGAADSVRVRLTGRGGHTSRPQLTEDLTYALAKLVTDLPAALSRRLDPRSGASIVFGLIRAGSAPNVIPATGEVAGTVRMLEPVAWAEAATLVPGLIEQLLAPYGVESEIDYIRGVPPVVNDETATGLLGSAVADVLGPAATMGTLQSLGGEDFAWYLNEVPGAMGRLGTRTPGGVTYDLHQGDLRVDEGAVTVGAKVLAATALRALG